ncbi:7125_t:CDS:2, partial [Gigaspora margarita]
TWAEKLDTICTEILTGEHDSIRLFNLLKNKSITAHALYRINKENFQLLVEEAQIIQEEELFEFL